MSKLPKIGGSKRGPKRLAIARKIAAEGCKNWAARASMICDGIGSKETSNDLLKMTRIHSTGTYESCDWCR